MVLGTTEKNISIAFQKLAITSNDEDHCKTPTTTFFKFQIKNSCSHRRNKRKDKAS